MCIVVIVGVSAVLNISTTRATLPISATSLTLTEATTATSVPKAVPEQQLRTKVVNDPATSSIPASNVTLTVSGRLYAAYASTGSNVLDLMRSLASTSDLTFTGREYPSLGFFVDSIQGKKAENGYNWILYVNGKSSDTGASQTKLGAGDAIEWKYEKNY